MLYNKIEENQSLNQRIELNQIEHTNFLKSLLFENQPKEDTDPICHNNDKKRNFKAMRDIVKSHLIKVSKGFSDMQNPIGNSLSSALISSLDGANDGQESKGLSSDDLKILINLT